MNTRFASLPRGLATLVAVVITMSLTGYGADPRSLLDEMSLACRNAPTYSDNTHVCIRSTSEGTEVDRLESPPTPQPPRALIGKAATPFVLAALGLPPQQIAPRRQPDRFKLVRAWQAENVAVPGNVSCFDEGGAATIVGLDGWRTVVVLDPSGRKLARYELDLPADAAVGFLRTAVDANGKRWWLGGNRGGQQVFVFNEAWKLHAAYPALESPAHFGIRTAQLVDLDADGTPEIVVVYDGTVGMQAASLDGHRLWREHSFDTVLDVVPDAPHKKGRRGLVCVNGRGRLVPVTIEGTGADARPVEGPGQGAGERRKQPDWAASPAVTSLFAGPVAPDGAWALLGLASQSVGKNMAVGLGPLPGQFWELDLPDGVHRDGPIEPVAWADLLGTPRRQWLIAAPDGSVTVAWADGRVVDRYRHGAPLVGIGGYRDGNEGFIVIATRDSLEGYRIDDVALD